jgi:hypothetical protein
VNVIPPVVGTNNIRYADFVRITTSSATYRFSTAPVSLTIGSIDALPFSGLGQLVNVGNATRDIKSTANETTITLVGIDTTMLALVLGADIKGSQIEMWHGFFNTNNELIGTTPVAVGWTNSSSATVTWTNSSSATVGWTSIGGGTVYKFFTGFINSFAINEQWMEESRSFVGTINVSASSIQLVLQNRVAGRYTNNNSWQFYNSADTSMNRVNYISTINYFFGKDALMNS